MRTNLLIVLFLLLTQVVSAANGVLINGIYYQLDSSKKEAEVTNGPNSENVSGYFDDTSLTYYTNTVTVPQSVTYNGVTYKVTSIGENAFAVNRRLKKVNLPESVVSIQENAFTCCDDMQSIYIPKSVKYIEYGVSTQMQRVLTRQNESLLSEVYRWSSAKENSGYCRQ